MLQPSAQSAERRAVVRDDYPTNSVRQSVFAEHEKERASGDGEDVLVRENKHSPENNLVAQERVTTTTSSSPEEGPEERTTSSAQKTKSIQTVNKDQKLNQKKKSQEKEGLENQLSDAERGSLLALLKGVHTLCETFKFPYLFDKSLLSKCFTRDLHLLSKPSGYLGFVFIIFL